VRQAMPWIRFDDTERGARTTREKAAAGGVDPSVLRSWFGRFITRYSSAHAVAPNPRPLTDTAFAAARQRGAKLQRNPWSRCAWIREGKSANLFVAGDSHACSIDLAKTVCAQRELPLDAAIDERDLAVLRALIDAGHLAIARPARARSSE